MAFIQHAISVTFKLADKNTFTESGTNQVTVANRRISCDVMNAGVPSGSELHMSIYGMTLSTMNDLATLGQRVALVPKNTVTVVADDATVFVGTVLNAWADFGAAPEVAFRVEAISGLGDAIAPVPPSSFKGSTDVVNVMQSFAGKMGLNFENNNVNAKLSNCYFPGTIRDQALACAKHAGIGVDFSNGTLSIWPGNGTRGGTTPTVSPDDGTMVGYPSFIAEGILIKTLFNPSIKFMGQIKVQGSQITPANGTWGIFGLNHSLESQMPHGQWFSIVSCFNPKFAPPAPPSS